MANYSHEASFLGGAAGGVFGFWAGTEKYNYLTALKASNPAQFAIENSQYPFHVGEYLPLADAAIMAVIWGIFMGAAGLAFKKGK